MFCVTFWIVALPVILFRLLCARRSRGERTRGRFSVLRGFSVSPFLNQHTRNSRTEQGTVTKTRRKCALYTKNSYATRLSSGGDTKRGITSLTFESSDFFIYTNQKETPSATLRIPFSGSRLFARPFRALNKVQIRV